jgi:hypothetical protein
MNNWLIALITILLFTVAVWIPDAMSASKPPIVRIGIIGIVRDGPAGRLPDITGIVKEEILRVTAREFDVRFPAEMTIHGNWKIADIKKAVDTLLADPKVDLVITLGYLATNYVCHKGKLPKPVVAPIVVDAKLQNLPLKDGASGVKNLSYIDPFISFERDIRVFQETTIWWFSSGRRLWSLFPGLRRNSVVLPMNLLSTYILFRLNFPLTKPWQLFHLIPTQFTCFLFRSFHLENSASFYTV